MVTSVSDFTNSPILGSAFRYDQLNRLVKAVHYDDMVDNEWGAPLPSGEGSWEGSHSPDKNSDHYSAYFYDANGNIRRLERNAHGTDVHMDRMTYTYPEHSNRLTTVSDTVPSGTWATDFDDMADDFIYDLDGRLIVDPSAQIYGINWNAQGKVRTIGREGGSTKATLLFHYDGMGNRVRKVSIPKDGSGGFLPIDQWDITYYIRDAQGNHLTTLDRKIVPIDEDEAYDELHIKETVMYGSDRLGVRNWAALPSWQGGAGGGLIAKRKFTHNGLDNPENFPEPDDYTGSVITSTAPANYATHLEGTKRYELKNHLGNVLATVSDKRDVVDNALAVEYYTPRVDNPSFYYPFGSLMPGLSDLGGDHQFGFQNQRLDNEIKGGKGKTVYFKYRLADTDLGGRFWSPDPLESKYPWNSPYAFSENRVIDGIELEGLERIGLDVSSNYFGNPALKNGSDVEIRQYQLNSGMAAKPMVTLGKSVVENGFDNTTFLATSFLSSAGNTVLGLRNRINRIGWMKTLDDGGIDAISEEDKFHPYGFSLQQGFKKEEPNLSTRVSVEDGKRIIKGTVTVISAVVPTSGMVESATKTVIGAVAKVAVDAIPESDNVRQPNEIQTEY